MYSNPSMPRSSKAPRHTSPVTPPIPFVPLLKPPLPRYIPRLPLRSPLPPSLQPPSGLTREEFVVPAAHPRRYRGSYGTLQRISDPFHSQLVVAAASSEDKKRYAIQAADTAIGARSDAVELSPDEVEKGDLPGLWMAAERWKSDVARGLGVTLVVSHANGFQKESWIPTIRRLLDRGPPQTTSSFGGSAQGSGASTIDIDEIWLLDDTRQGASVDLNAGLLGPVRSWPDAGRDIISFIERSLPPTGVEPASQLLGWSDLPGRRKVIGIGHSMGGNALTIAAATRPDLFHAVLLVEPVVKPAPSPRGHMSDIIKYWPLVYGAIKRRSTWPSADTARESFRSSPFFASWHDDVLRLFTTHGLSPIDPRDPEGEVTLTTPSWSEASVFAEPTGLQEGWDKLAELTVPTGFVMGGKSDLAMFGGMETVDGMLWRPERARNERLEIAGHLIPHERPEELADTVWRFIGAVMSGNWDSAQTSDTKAKL